MITTSSMNIHKDVERVLDLMQMFSKQMRTYVVAMFHLHVNNLLLIYLSLILRKDYLWNSLL